MKKIALLLVVTCVLAAFPAQPAMAASESVKSGASSLLVPGWGQYRNGEFETRSGKIKSWTMIAVEVAAIVTTAVVGGVVGGPAVWAGVGVLIANHVWSSLDAYHYASKDPGVHVGAGQEAAVN